MVALPEAVGDHGPTHDVLHPSLFPGQSAVLLQCDGHSPEFLSIFSNLHQQSLQVFTSQPPNLHKQLSHLHVQLGSPQHCCPAGLGVSWGITLCCKAHCPHGHHVPLPHPPCMSLALFHASHQPRQNWWPSMQPLGAWTWGWAGACMQISVLLGAAQGAQQNQDVGRIHPK